MSVIKLGNGQFFSTDDGIVISESQARRLIKNAIAADSNVQISPTVQKIVGNDSVTISLDLVSQNQHVPNKNGFFIQVFLSGTDGRLVRLYADDFIDPASLAPQRGGFAQYIDLEVDV